MAVAKLFVEIAADATDFSNKLSGMTTQINATATSFKQIGTSLSGAGRTLTGGLTVPIVALGTAATTAAISMESAFAGVRKTVDTTEEGFARLLEGLIAMSKTKPMSAVELAGIMELGGQLGIDPANLLGFTSVVADLSETTDLTAEDAAMQLAQFANIMGMAEGDFGRLGAVIVDLGNNMATTEADIVSMAMRLAGAGQVVGMSEADVVSLAAALASVGINAEAGGTAMSRVMVDMAQAVAGGGDELDGFASVAGMTGEAFATAFGTDPAGAIVAFVNGLGAMQTAGANVFGVLDDLGLGEIRVRDALLRAAGAGELFGSALDTGASAWAANTALTDEAAKRYETMASKLSMLKNKLLETLITLGGPLIDALTAALVAAEPLFKAIQMGATAFANMDPAMQQTIITVLGLVAALGPALMVIGGVISGVGSIIGAVGSIGTVLSTVVGAIGTAGGAIAAALGAISAPVLAIIAVVIAAIGALYLAWTNNWGGIQEKTAAVWDWLTGAFQDIVGWLGTAIPAAGAVLTGWWTDTLLPALQSVWSWIDTNLKPLFDALANVWLAWVRLEVALLAFLWTNVLLPAFQAVGGYITDSVIPALTSLWSTITTILQPAIEWFTTNVLDPFVAGFMLIPNAIASATTWLNNLATSVAGISLPDWLTPGSPTPFETGLWGIADALRAVDGEAGGLNIAGAYPRGGGASGGMGAGGSSYNVPIHITINGAADREEVRIGVLDGLRAAGMTP